MRGLRPDTNLLEGTGQEEVQMRRITAVFAAVAIFVVGLAAAGYADPGDTSSCVTGHWPADVQGSPANLAKLGPTGLYVWHDDTGWSIAVTHSSTTHVTFAGRITTDGQLYGTERRTENNDHVVFSESANAVAYKFQNYGGIDGIHFNTKCANRLTFSGTLDGVTLKPTQVFIGSNAHHPGGVPFVIRRVS
jgi:hypothetical protein